MDRAWCKIWSLTASAWPVLAGAAITAFMWIVIGDSLKARLILAAVALAVFIYWFADGVVNWRRACVPCSAKGAFESKLSSRLNRPCSCCLGSVAGGGRHPTIRSRIWGRMGGAKH